MNQAHQGESAFPRGLWRRLSLSFALLFLAACAKHETAVQSGNRDQILHRGIGFEVGDLDPHLAATISELDISSALFEGLTAEDPNDLHPIPGVAESWTLAADQVTYTFHLRANAKWSNGEPVTAQDFIGSWQRILTPSLGAGNAQLLYALRGAQAFHEGRVPDFSRVGASAPDARTLKVTLERPTSYFLSLLAHPAWMPVPLATIAANGGKYDRGNSWSRAGKLIGNGPFSLKTWEPNKTIILEKSASYWDAGKVRLNAIHFYPIESEDTEERAFRAGQLHVTYLMPFGKVASYRRESPQFLRTDPYLNTYFFRLNLNHAPLDNEGVRLALDRAVDRAAIVGKLLHGGQQVATAITPPGLPGYTPPNGPTTDFDAARAALAKAGFPGGKGLPTIELLFNNSANLRLLAEATQEMWRRELGVEIRLVGQEFKSVLADRRAGRYQMILSDWVGDYLDPTTFLDLWRSDNGNNYTGWANHDYDRLLSEAAQASDPAIRAAKLKQGEALMLAAAPIIPLYYNTHAFLLQTSVKGWHPTLLDHHPYKYVWLEP